MKFLYPDMLWGLLAIAVPILVHLFNFRKFKRILFSNVDFLKDIKQETKSKSKLKHLLILASRILAITAIVLAFAQPYIPVGNNSAVMKSKEVSLYIDNSFSMESEQENGRLLDLAKNKALEIVDIYQTTDKFQVLTNDFEGRHQRLLSKEEVQDYIEEVQLSPNKKMISEVVSRQQDLLLENEETAKFSYLLSDLQISTHDFGAIQADTSITFRSVPTLADQDNNCYIDTVWLETPLRQINKVERLRFKLVNASNKKVSKLPVNLYINGQPRAVASYDIDENSVLDTVLTFKNNEIGHQSALLEIEDFPVVFDNSYFFSFEVTDQINILEIRGSQVKTSHISKLFENDEQFVYVRQNELNVDYGTLSDFDFIVVNGLVNMNSGLSNELKKFIGAGGSVYLIPSPIADISSYNSFSSSVGGPNINGRVLSKNEVTQLNAEDPIYKGSFESIPKQIDLPKVNSYLDIYAPVSNTSRTLLFYRDGKSFLTSNNFKSGKFYLNSVSLDAGQSNYGQHAIFVTSMIRMAEFSTWNTPLAYEIGQQQVVNLKSFNRGNEESVIIQRKEDGFEFLPGIQNGESTTELFIYDQIKEAGVYDVVFNSQILSKLAFNYSREESDLKSFSIAELEEEIDPLGKFEILDADIDSIRARTQDLNEGVKYWRIMIIFALAFLILEVLLVKLWK